MIIFTSNREEATGTILPPVVVPVIAGQGDEQQSSHVSPPGKLHVEQRGAQKEH